MIDLKITEKGDLVLSEAAEEAKVKVVFHSGADNTILITFDLRSAKREPDVDGLQVNFIPSKNSDLRHKAEVIKGLESKMQQIRIALMGVRGELKYRPDVGSELVRYRHGDIHDPKTLTGVKNTVLKAIAGILESPTVYVKTEQNNSGAFFNNINIYIYEQGVRIFKFKV